MATFTRLCKAIDSVVADGMPGTEIAYLKSEYLKALAAAADAVACGLPRSDD